MRPLSTTDNLTIQNCHTLRLSFLCHSANFPLQSLTVANVKNLIIIPGNVIHNPPRIHFQNVYNTEFLPRQTFYQIRRATYRQNCILPTRDLEEITFENVHFGTIETEAFTNLTNIKTFKWQNVTANHIQTSAIQIHMSQESTIEMIKNKFDIMEHLAFRLTTTTATFANNTFGYLHGSSINGTISYFNFVNNNVATIDSNGIQLLAYQVIISNNYFNYLYSNALLKISPGLLFDSRRNFATIMFVYEFSNNKIKYSDVGGINPDFDAYKNVASNITIKNNLLHCSCQKLGWMSNNMEYQHGFQHIHKFYHYYFLNATNQNYCYFDKCNLQLNFVQNVMCNNKYENLNKYCKTNAKKLASNANYVNFSQLFTLLCTLLLLSF